VQLQGNVNTTEEEHFAVMLVQTEVERIKFVLRSYLRCRLQKVCKFICFYTLRRLRLMSDGLQIEKYTPFILATPEVQRNLSELEQNYVQRHVYSPTALILYDTSLLTFDGPLMG
jgi:hypothetical protein